jgi:hypothetical protein
MVFLPAFDQRHKRLIFLKIAKIYGLIRDALRYRSQTMFPVRSRRFGRSLARNRPDAGQFIESLFFITLAGRHD